jgi:3-keto-5-aminohexanoate cleavage enzyme
MESNSPPAIIEAALNGGRSRAEHPALPVTPEEIADEARRCAAAGASVVHIHAQGEDGSWRADLDWYAAAIRAIRAAAPGLLISLTTIRPESVHVATVNDLLTTLAADAATRPDLASVNLGHGVAWERDELPGGRRTIHFPNSHDDIAATLGVCAATGIVPELGVMDIGYIANAVALRHDGLLPALPWFLLELDAPAFGSGRQVAPATVPNYDFLAHLLREHFPAAPWAAHGHGHPGYAVLERALATGAHIRVGFEDCLHLPDGTLAPSNAAQVEWAVATARALGREPATPDEARAIIGL